MTPPTNGYLSNRVLKLNVGFLLTESHGTSRQTELDTPALAVADDLKLAFLKADLRLSRTSEGILVQGTFETAVESECSRCLTELTIPIEAEVEELFATNPEADTEFFIGEDAVLDLTPLVREEIILHVPMAPVCQEACAGLCPTCGQNFNEGACTCEPDDIDPRFAVLMQLRDQDSPD